MNHGRRFLAALAAVLLLIAPHSTPALASQEGGAAASAPFVVTANQSLRGSVRDVELSEVLRQIGRVAGMAIVGTPANGDARVSLDLDDVPVAEALRRVLRGSNYTLALKAGRSGVRVARLTILGGARGPRAVQPRGAQAEEVAIALGPKDGAPAETPPDLARLSARLEEVSELAKGQTPGASTEALREIFAKDSDSLVRQAALTGLGQQAALSANELLDVATNDADASVRLRSIELLPGAAESSPAVYETLERLVSDEADPMTRAVIESAMSEIEARRR